MTTHLAALINNDNPKAAKTYSKGVPSHKDKNIIYLLDENQVGDGRDGTVWLARTRALDKKPGF